MNNKKMLILLLILAAVLCATVGAAFAYSDYSASRLQEELENCGHERYENGVCARCGAPCEHEFSQGQCLVCGQPCPHQWKNGSCQLCGMACEHEWRDGRCAVCGQSCRHEWRDSVCTVCGMACPHVQHDVDGYCTSCGKKMIHHYVSGMCECGAKPIVHTRPLSQETYNVCSEQGSIHLVDYQAKLYSTSSVTVIKRMRVYLPYGYDEKEKYNVLVMVHGGGGNDGDWMDNIIDTELGTSVCMRNVYDNMIQQRLMKPMIIVTPCTDAYVYGAGYVDTGPEQLAPELREDILPYIAEHYSTYAEDGSIEALQAAREHFGIGGCSNGALYAYNAGLAANLDIFSNFLCFSGCNNVNSTVQVLESQPYTVSCLYAGAGSGDTQKDTVTSGYWYVVDNSTKLTPGENTWIETISGGHTWDTWGTLFYNAAQLLFQEE